jgi:hypothetical protein
MAIPPYFYVLAKKQTAFVVSIKPKDIGLFFFSENLHSI